MISKITVDEQSSVPKYIQVAEKIIDLVEAGKLGLGERLPSINEAYRKLKISRDTLISAYNELKSRGVIVPMHGKGFYISNLHVPRKLKIFMLFDVMNGYKAILYRSLMENLGADCIVDIYFHHYNKQLFESLINSNLGNYGYYIIMPHFNEDVSSVLTKIPDDKLLLIDNISPELKTSYAAVYQDFENDIFSALNSGIELIKKYKRIFMIVNKEFQFIPNGLISGFQKFCTHENIDFGFVDRIEEYEIKTGDAFIAFADQDLVQLIKASGKLNLALGSAMGIISYDDTPLKEVLANGITVITTDFPLMGKTAAEMVLHRNRKVKANPCYLIKRKSL